jgi:hypothetical protein
MNLYMVEDMLPANHDENDVERLVNLSRGYSCFNACSFDDDGGSGVEP